MARIARDDIAFFYDYGIMTTTRTLYVGEYPAGPQEGGGGTDFRLADRVVKGLHVLEARGLEPITLIVNNPGGDEYAGLAIYDAIRMSRCHTTVHVFGHAMSMASWFIQAADTRLMSPASSLMIHYGEAFFEGHALDAPRFSKEVGRLNHMMEKHYLRRINEKWPNYTIDTLREKMLFDCYLTASSAVTLGLADTLLEYPVE